jgi:CrcB protein
MQNGNMLKDFLLVGIGGAIGSILRFFISILMKSVNPFPLATLSVNCIGSLFIGILTGMAIKESHPNWHLLLATGICGGFTTFSAFSLEGMQLLQQQKTGLYLIYAGGNIILGLFFVWLGWKMTR